MCYRVHNMGTGSALSRQLSIRNENHLCLIYIDQDVFMQLLGL